jgi:hypothetical protein
MGVEDAIDAVKLLVESPRIQGDLSEYVNGTIDKLQLCVRGNALLCRTH